ARPRSRAAPGGADLHPWNGPRSTFAVRQGTCGLTPPSRLATLAAHVTEGPVDDSQQRKAIARALLAADVSDVNEDALVLAGAGLRAPAKAAAPFPFSYPDGLAPVPRPLAAPPASDAPMPLADVLVVTWT